MRKNMSFFVLSLASHTAVCAGYDSAVQSTYSGDCTLGKFVGNQSKVAINAIVVDGATDQDKWRVVNLKNENGFDSIAVLGAVDSEEAVNLSIQHYCRDYDSMNQSYEVAETSANGLNRYLNTPTAVSTKHVINWKLAEQQHVLTTGVHAWDSMNPTGQYKNIASLLHEITLHDDNSNLLVGYDSLATLLADEKAETEDGYDAIYGDYQHLDKFMDLLTNALTMHKGNLEIVKAEQSKPFKKNKVTQVAQVFQLNDGQSISIFYHNPEVTPTKLKPTDNLISWKFLLNKHDISGVIQPNQGEGISIAEIAGRLMRLANQNSARFKRTAEKKAQVSKDLEEAQNAVTAKQEQIVTLDAKIADLQKQLSEKATKPNNHEHGDALFTSYANSVLNRIDAGLKDQVILSSDGENQTLKIGHFTLIQNENLVELVSGEGATKESMLKTDLKSSDDYDKAFNAKINQAISLLRNIDALKKFYAEKTKDLDSEQIETAQISLDNHDDGSQLNFGDGYQLRASESGFSLVDKDEKELLKSELANVNNLESLESVLNTIFDEKIEMQEPEDNPSQDVSKFPDDDVQYLKDIISGKESALDADMDRIIHLAEIDENDTLLTQAMDKIKIALDEASA